MVAAVIIVTTTGYDVPSALFVNPRQIDAAQMVVKPALPYQIGSCYGICTINNRRHQVIAQFVIHPELFVVSKAAGVIQRGIQAAVFAQIAGKVKVIMTLAVIVCFVGVGIIIISGRIGGEQIDGIFSGFVRYAQIAVIMIGEARGIIVELFYGHTPPGLKSLFFSSKTEKLNAPLSFHVSGGNHVRLQSARGAIHKPIAAHARKSDVCAPVAAHQASTCRQRNPARIEAAKSGFYHGIRILTAESLHVHRSAKCTCAIAAGSGTALYLHTAQAGC